MPNNTGSKGGTEVATKKDFVKRWCGDSRVLGFSRAIPGHIKRYEQNLTYKRMLFSLLKGYKFLFLHHR